MVVVDSSIRYGRKCKNAKLLLIQMQNIFQIANKMTKLHQSRVRGLLILEHRVCFQLPAETVMCLYVSIVSGQQIPRLNCLFVISQDMQSDILLYSSQLSRQTDRIIMCNKCNSIGTLRLFMIGVPESTMRLRALIAWTPCAHLFAGFLIL